jgi:hypothetical protein
MTRIEKWPDNIRCEISNPTAKQGRLAKEREIGQVGGYKRGFAAGDRRFIAAGLE